MKLHPNARLTVHGRRVLVRRVCCEGWRLALAAEAVGVSRRTAAKWIARYRREAPRVLWRLRSAPGSVESRFWTQAAWVLVMLFNSNSIGVSMPRLECRRRRLWKTSRYSKIALASSTRVFQHRESSSSTCIRDQNASIMALS